MAGVAQLKTGFILAALLIGLTNVEARVGDTAQQVDERYGKPKRETQQAGGNFSREYGYQGYRVVAAFRHGVCYAESYRKIPPVAFLPAEISALLSANAGGGKWKQTLNVGSGPSALLFYQGSDNRTAIYDPSRHTLHFSKVMAVIEKTVEVKR